MSSGGGIEGKKISHGLCIGTQEASRPAPITIMKGKAMSRIIRFIIITLAASSALAAQEGESLLSSGIDALQSGSYQTASGVFQSVLADPLSPDHSEALYWLIKTDIVLERYDEASAWTNQFIANYSSSERLGEVIYHRARLMYLQDQPNKAIAAMGEFIDEYSDSTFIPSAHYWIGESLTALGRLDEAHAVFAGLIERFPASSKREAARFRMSEISLLYREKELLDLLRWSHEEHLRDAEDFYRREKEYIDALAVNQNQFSEQGETHLYTERLLEAKARLLDMRSDYLNKLMELYDAN